MDLTILLNLSSVKGNFNINLELITEKRALPDELITGHSLCYTIINRVQQVKNELKLSCKQNKITREDYRKFLAMYKITKNFMNLYYLDLKIELITYIA